MGLIFSLFFIIDKHYFTEVILMLLLFSFVLFVFLFIIFVSIWKLDSKRAQKFIFFLLFVLFVAPRRIKVKLGAFQFD